MPGPPFAPAWPLETERLTLRPFEHADLDAVFAMQSDPENARWLYNEPRDLAAVKTLLEVKIAAHEVSEEGAWLGAAVVERASGALVADVALRWASATQRGGELGFICDRRYHGRGYATEAARALLAFGFEEMGLHRVIGRLEPRNLGSARVLEKLGMRREALLVENEWVKGEWQSELQYALLEREWRAATGTNEATG